eukprot:IDg4304t1
MFCASKAVIKVLDAGVSVPKATTLKVRLKELMKKRRADVCRNLAASGIAEEPTPLDLRLDDLIEDIDTKKSIESENKEEEKRKAKALCTAGEDIRSMALKRVWSSTDEDDCTPKKKRKKQTMVVLEAPIDTELKMLQDAAVGRVKNETQRLKLEERRLALEEKKFELEKEERKAQLNMVLAVVQKLG